MPIKFNFDFDFLNPDYGKVFQYRAEKLKKIRNDISYFPLLKQFYKKNPAQFIIDWGCTYDPRNVEIGDAAVIPFLLFEKQEEWVGWVFDLWRKRESGLTEKSRDMGVSWLSVALACTLCIFYSGITIGFGSKKKDLVDNSGDPKSLFHKIRQFISLLPHEFRAGCDINNKRYSSYMKVHFPFTGSNIVGESGDALGRGGRTSLFFTDEAAHLERPYLIEGALSNNTNCRIDVSTPFGTNNPFYQKKISGKTPVFTFHWRDDPRKDDEWYRKKCDAINDPVIIAQELDLNYTASLEGIVIPSAWVQSAIDSHVVLGISPSGIKLATLDVADEGKDMNAMAGRHGILIDHLELWSGKNYDIYRTVENTLNKCSILNYPTLYYDADGLGAGVRGDAKKINDNFKIKINVKPFRGSGEVLNPKSQTIPGRLNEDFFANLKAQAWWELRTRFQETHRAVIEGLPYNKDKIISISKNCNNLLKLIVELSQPTYSLNSAGKILIDKSPNGTKSPNLADAVMMAFAPTRRGFYDV